jgi:dipeptidyl aminopeptidase/acylaminoacyl peptidase
MLKAVAYLQDGQLTLADTERQGWLGGSYSGLILYQAFWEDPTLADAMVLVGNISDGFLWVQALYDETLEIPDWHVAAIAALGRPDKVPEFYLQHSPAFFAEYLPPALVIHTTADEVVPYNQSLRLDEALTAAGATHELFIYEDTSHYLDQVNITPDTAEVYRRMTVFLDTYVRQQRGDP